MCYLLNHIVYSKDAHIPDYSLTTDGGDHGSPTGPSECSQLKILSTRVPNGFFRSRCDQDPYAIRPMFEFDPCDKSYDKIFSPPQENGELITEKGNKVLTTNSTVEVQNQKVDRLISYSLEQPIFNLKLILDWKIPCPSQNTPILTN